MLTRTQIRRYICAVTDVSAYASETPIARLVREQGRIKGWLAKQIGCDRSRLSRILSGERTMTVEEAARAARALGVPMETFVQEDK